MRRTGREEGRGGELRGSDISTPPFCLRWYTTAPTLLTGPPHLACMQCMASPHLACMQRMVAPHLACMQRMAPPPGMDAVHGGPPPQPPEHLLTRAHPTAPSGSQAHPASPAIAPPPPAALCIRSLRPTPPLLPTDLVRCPCGAPHDQNSAHRWSLQKVGPIMCTLPLMRAPCLTHAPLDPVRCRVLYDRSTHFWSLLLSVLNCLPRAPGRGRDGRKGLFWAAHQRFYKGLLIAAKVRMRMRARQPLLLRPCVLCSEVGSVQQMRARLLCGACALVHQGPPVLPQRPETQREGSPEGGQPRGREGIETPTRGAS